MTEVLPAPSGPRKTTVSPPSGQKPERTRRPMRSDQFPIDRQGCLSIARIRNSVPSRLRQRLTGVQSPELAAETISAVFLAPQKRATCCWQPAGSCAYRALSLRPCASFSCAFAIFLAREQLNSTCGAGVQKRLFLHLLS